MIPPPWGADTQVLCARPDLKITWGVIYVIIYHVYNYIWHGMCGGNCGLDICIAEWGEQVLARNGTAAGGCSVRLGLENAGRAFGGNYI